MDGSATNGFSGALPEDPVVLDVLDLSGSPFSKRKMGTLCVLGSCQCSNQMPLRLAMHLLGSTNGSFGTRGLCVCVCQTCGQLLWGSSPLYWKLKGCACLWLGREGREAYPLGILFLNSSLPVSGLPKQPGGESF